SREGDAQPAEEIAAQHGADDSHGQVSTQAETAPTHDQTRQPARHQPNYQKPEDIHRRLLFIGSKNLFQKDYSIRIFLKSNPGGGGGYLRSISSSVLTMNFPTTRLRYHL